MKKNLLIKADNLTALQWLLENDYREKIDLIYIDPPFATGNNFSIDKTGRVSTISKSSHAIRAYDDKLKGKSFIHFLQQRLILLHQLLSEQGSLYLHTDYKVGHYVKVMMDEIFGIENFRNDISRIKCNPKNFSRIGYGNIKDMILFYTKTAHPIWNEPRRPYSEEEIKKLYPKIDSRGKRYTTVPLHAPGETKQGNTSLAFKGLPPPVGRHWRCAVEELEQLDKKGLIEWSEKGNPRKINYAEDMMGKKVQDIWEFKDPPYPTYPTQKNMDLLQFIIQASSHQNSIVLDCFCGSGTTLQAATHLNRAWIGIDISDVAIATTKKNLQYDSLYQPYEYIEL